MKDDLFGAAIAACGHEPGIVCILGSGSNCAYFNGKVPEENNFGLGYILGDEGSANFLGKLLLKNYLEQKLPKNLIQSLEDRYHIDRTIILEKIYKKPNAQNYLSSFFDFYIEHRKNHFIQQLIEYAFDQYINTYLKPTLNAHPNQNIHFVGTVAGTFEDHLRIIAQKNNIKITSITKEPINNLIEHYAN